jgi:hypothetical protein
MDARVMLGVLSVCVLGSGMAAQGLTGQRAQQRTRAGRTGQGRTRPPAENERGLRALTAEEIPPNLTFMPWIPYIVTIYAITPWVIPTGIML